MQPGKCIAIFTSLCFTGTIRADSADIELHHLSVSKFVDQWVCATEASGGGVPIQKSRTSFGVTLNGTKLEIDQRKNKLTVIGDEKAIHRVKEMAKALDLVAPVIQLKCIRLRVGLQAGGSALDVLGEGESRSSVFPAGKIYPEWVLKKAKDNGRVEVISNLEAFCTSNEEASFTSSTQAGETSQVVVTPVVNSSRQITLSLANTNEKHGGVTSLNAKVSITDGAAILLGGAIEKDSMGNSVEFPLLLQANILNGNAR